MAESLTDIDAELTGLGLHHGYLLVGVAMNLLMASVAKHDNILASVQELWETVPWQGMVRLHRLMRLELPATDGTSVSLCLEYCGSILMIHFPSASVWPCVALLQPCVAHGEEQPEGMPPLYPLTSICKRFFGGG